MIGCVGECPDIAGDFRFQTVARRISLSVLPQTKLTVLPGQATNYCVPGLYQTGMDVAADQVKAVRPSGDLALQKGSPMDFLFAQRYRDTQHLMYAFCLETHGLQHNSVAHLAGHF
jgi:hypothetical protein